ncbi:alpha/beta fold hydrolase [Nonomuraea phyllanthi]|uniref:alpha/beta fold hydrolase n=1 Tax=Nonomuraea phyllanthi TaxID=2219224 RepID=UPI00221E852A|nr:alpha/beta hydrolase [Nonomuraea phyllanthi]
MSDSSYLGELGGLSAYRRLVMLDPRGTGASAIPEDASSYRCDRLVDDVEALREHLGLDRVDLLGHSAGVNLAVLYAARHPERVGRLALICPSTTAVGIATSGEARLELARRREGEPWYPRAYAALEAILSGTGTDWEAVEPFRHGRWDAAAQALHADEERRRNDEAAAVFAAEGAFDPEATRGALAAFEAPVLVVAGELDMNTVPAAATEFAGLFPDAELVLQPGAGHFPWRDDAGRFVEAVAAWLRQGE